MRFVIGVVTLLLSFTTNAVVIIQYHHIDNATPASTSVTPHQFEQHLDYLAQQHFKVWPLAEIVTSLQQGKTLPDKVIAITFDDAYQSVYDNALPLLQKYGYPFTVFVTTGLVGGKYFMSWDELRRIKKQGGEIANHTVSHPHLIRMHSSEDRMAWETRVKNEIIQAEKMLRQHVGSSSGLFAYPYGEYNLPLKLIVKQLGFIGLTQHSGAFDSRVDWQALPRFAFGGEYAELSGFMEKVNSLPMPILSAEVSDSSGRLLHDTILPVDVVRPILSLKLSSSDIAQRVQCYASGQGRLDLLVTGQQVSMRTHAALPVGRSKINCTAASNQAGRYYWYSQFFIRKNSDGSWYNEQ